MNEEKEIIRLSVMISHLFFTQVLIKSLLSKEEVVRLLSSMSKLVFEEMNSKHLNTNDFDEVEKTTKQLLFETYKLKV